MSTALERAVTALGSQSAFARFIGVSQPSVWAWIVKGRPLPAEYVLKVEAETGISRHELRPDLYPLEGDPPVHAADPNPDQGEAATGKAFGISGSVDTDDSAVAA